MIPRSFGSKENALVQEFHAEKHFKLHFVDQFEQ